MLASSGFWWGRGEGDLHRVPDDLAHGVLFHVAFGVAGDLVVVVHVHGPAVECALHHAAAAIEAAEIRGTEPGRHGHWIAVVKRPVRQAGARARRYRGR